MFSKKEIQIILVLSLVVLFVSGVAFAAYNHFSKQEPLATEDFSDLKTVLSESGEDYGYIIEEGEGEDTIEGVSYFQIFEREYSLKEEILEGFVEQVVLTKYKIVRGDSIFSIARRNNISEDILKFNNPDLEKTLKIGQELNIYNGNYISYKVAKGDTILAIANKFGVKVTDILRLNSLDTSEIKEGQELILKNPDLKTYNDSLASSKISTGKVTQLPPSTSTGGGRVGRARDGFAIRWPVRWAGINSPFGSRFHPVLKRNIFHQGIDTPVRYEPAYAAADGTVSTAGSMGAYGLIVIIKHANGYETRYAHMSKLSVKAGQKVKAGDRIGTTGATGRVTGPHLHFEIRKNGKALNPMLYR